MDQATKAGLVAQQSIDAFVESTSPPSDLITQAITLSALLSQKVAELRARGVSTTAIYRDPYVTALYAQLIGALMRIGQHPVSLRDIIGEVEEEIQQEPVRTYDDDGLPLWLPLVAGAVAYGAIKKHGGSKMADKVPLEVPSEHLPGKMTEDITSETLKAITAIVASRKAQVTLALVETLKIRAQSVAKQNKQSLKWVSELDSSTCRACLGMHGRIFEPGETIPRGHVNCRCVLVPVPKGTEDSDKEAMAYLKKKSPEERKKILGAEGAEKFSKGELDLSKAFRIQKIDGVETLTQGKVKAL